MTTLTDESLDDYLSKRDEASREAEAKLRRILSSGKPLKSIRRRALRLRFIRSSARRIFPEDYLLSDGYLEMLNPSQAIKELNEGNDPVAILSRLITLDQGEEEVDSFERQCETCGEILPPAAFYDYGSTSCRRCNAVGRRYEAAWRF